MNYRADIDGLRAIAVLAVIVYHFKWLSGFSGGYIGVDIFFVISGYLIGGIIIEETASGRFSYVQFYSRRIKRLLAAFLLVGLATVAVSWWLLLPADLWAESKSLLASTVFLSNVLFYREAGYFDPASLTKPLLHTWSLWLRARDYEVYLLQDAPEIPEFSSRKLLQAVRGGHSDVQDTVSRFGAVSLAAVECREGWLRLLRQISLRDKWICLGGGC